MSSSDENKIEESIKSCYSTWGDRYYDEYYKSDSAYPPVHTDLIRKVLAESGARSLLDAGCGPASMLRDLDGLGLNRFGFDLTPEMLDEAKKVMAKQGVSEDHLWLGSVTDASSFKCPNEGVPETFDAAICFGVFPHIPKESDATAIANIVDATAPGGLVAIEARNQLFSLFTLNRYSREFFQDILIDEKNLKNFAGGSTENLDQALATLDKQFRMDLPPIRKGHEDEPGYDEVLSRTHNPFELQKLARQQGLIDVQILFYHFHALPPMLEPLVPELFKKASIAMEDPTDWRGHFMASAFVVVGRKPS